MYIHKCTNKKTLEGGAHMEVTEVRIKKVNSGNKMKAVAQVTFDQEFVVHDIKVIEGRNGLFIAMPRKEKNGTFKDIVHPINQPTRQKLKIQNQFLKHQPNKKHNKRKY